MILSLFFLFFSEKVKCCGISLHIFLSYFLVYKLPIFFNSSLAFLFSHFHVFPFFVLFPVSFFICFFLSLYLSILPFPLSPLLTFLFHPSLSSSLILYLFSFLPSFPVCLVLFSLSVIFVSSFSLISLFFLNSILLSFS